MSRDAPVLLAGATGLVGQAVLARLLAPGRDGTVVAPVRRPLSRDDPRLVAIVHDPAAPDADAALRSRLRALDIASRSFVCCLGTTLRRAGSRDAFVAVDRDLVLRLAAIAREAGATHAVLVSSVGASAQSGNFYLRIKGEAERGLSALGFDSVDVLRPGLLRGERAESRPMETLAQRLAPVSDALMQGRLRRYRSIAADAVAAAAVALLASPTPGVHVHEHDALRRLASTD